VPELCEGALRFIFPDNWEACKLDGCVYYRKRFQCLGGGSKAVDFIAFESGTEVLWLIEVKDYRTHPRTKPSELFMDLAQKVRDSLACLCAMRTQAFGDDRAFARKALRQLRPRVVLHIEQPAHLSRLRPWVVDPKTAKQKAKQMLRAIDPHPEVGDQSALNGRLVWTVS